MTALGLIAGLCTTACWLPQVARSVRTRSTDDMSWAYLLVLTVGVALWSAYGVLRSDLALVLSNVLTLGSLAVLITVKSRPTQGVPVNVTVLPARLAAVLFDMDGTLVDSDAAVERAWAHWSRLRGVSLADIARVTPGRPATESIALLAPWLAPAERLADAEALLAQERTDLDDVTSTPGALELIAALELWAVPHAVVTSADDGLARARLAAAAVAVPEVLITSNVVQRGKPDPQGYLLAAARLGVPIGACLVVEDTLTGVQAGLAAGAVVAAVRDVEPAHFTVPHLHELRRVLARQFASPRPASNGLNR